MSISGEFLLVIMAFFTAAGQVLIKKGSASIVRGRGFRTFTFSFFNPALGAGLILALAAPLLYIRALIGLPLSRAFMFNSLSYLLVFLSGRIMLKEKAGILHWIGISLIISGFLLPAVLEKRF